MTIALAPEIEWRLTTEAAREGVSLDQYANRVLGDYISQAERTRHASLLALLQTWIDEAEGENEAEAAQEEDEFLRNLRENRVAFREISLPE
jgi:hypothetical protein